MNSDDDLKEFEKNFSLDLPKSESQDEGPEVLFDQYDNRLITNQNKQFFQKELGEPNQRANTNISTNPFTEFRDFIEKHKKDQNPFDDISLYGGNNDKMEIDKKIFEDINDNSFPNKTKNNYDNQSNNSEGIMINDEYFSDYNINDDNFKFSFNSNNYGNKKTESHPSFSQEVNNNSSILGNFNIFNNQNPNIISQKKNANTLFPNENEKINKDNEMQLEDEINIKDEEKNKKEERPRGRWKKGAKYPYTDYHGKEETENAVLSIIRSNNEKSHKYILNHIASSIGEDNEKVKIYKNKKGAFEAKLIKYDNNGKKVETILHIAPPNIKELVAKPENPNNRYCKIEHIIERCQEYFKETFMTLYSNYSWPKRLPGDYKSGISKYELIKDHNKSMKEFINTLLETEKNLEEKPITALLNLTSEDFMKVFINYDDQENPKKIIRVNHNEYGFNAFDLKDFEVYENCKHKFSDKEKERKKYRTHIIKILNKKVNKRKKNPVKKIKFKVRKY